MFTGIISDLGTVAARQRGRFSIRCTYAADSIGLGTSIACDGACLTAVEVAAEAGGGSVFTVDVSNETLAKTTLDEWQPGRRVNLERALRAGEELGGHLVAGHVDGVGRIIDMRDDGQSRLLLVQAPAQLARFIASKGSVALDGISLTVNAVSLTRFGVSIIPHTLTHTTLGARKPGDGVNLEVDLIARYVVRLIDMQRSAVPAGSPWWHPAAPWQGPEEQD
jgi:riboflavin synthase